MHPIVVERLFCLENERIPLYSVDLDGVDHERLEVLVMNFDDGEFMVIDREYTHS